LAKYVPHVLAFKSHHQAPIFKRIWYFCCDWWYIICCVCVVM